MPSQPSPLLALLDPGEGEGVRGQACRGDVESEQDSGGPQGHGPVDSFLPSVLRLVRVKKCKVRFNGSGFGISVRKRKREKNKE